MSSPHDQLFEEIRLLAREIQAIKKNKDVDYRNELAVIQEARKIVMDTYYTNDWDAHKWMMDVKPSPERKKALFAAYVNDKEIEEIASKMIEHGCEDEFIQRFTKLPLSTIRRLKDEDE